MRFGKSGVRGGVDLIYLKCREIVIAGSLFTCDCKYKEKKTFFQIYRGR